MAKDNNTDSFDENDINYEDLLKSFSDEKKEEKEEGSVSVDENLDRIALSELLDGIKAQEVGTPVSEDVIIDFAKLTEKDQITATFAKLDEMASESVQENGNVDDNGNINIGLKKSDDVESLEKTDISSILGEDTENEEETWNPVQFEQSIEDESVDYASLLGQIGNDNKTVTEESAEPETKEVLTESEELSSDMTLEELAEQKEPFVFDFGIVEEEQKEEDISNIETEDSVPELPELSENEENTDILSQPEIAGSIEEVSEGVIDYNKLVEESLNLGAEDNGESTDTTGSDTEEITSSLSFLDEEPPKKVEEEKKEDDLLGIANIGVKSSSKSVYSETMFEGITMEFDEQVSNVTLAEILLSQGKKKEAIERYKYVSENGGSTYWVAKRLNELLGDN